MENHWMRKQLIDSGMFISQQVTAEYVGTHRVRIEADEKELADFLATTRNGRAWENEMEEARDEAHNYGYDSGHDEGYDKGRDEAREEMIENLISRILRGGELDVRALVLGCAEEFGVEIPAVDRLAAQP